ncbi:hypothetical protein NSB24_26695 [Blautia coccoides]|uniref:hypothetical protein n=1 Tax=Blautia producta TaxID=33035 RepID=UPI00214A6ABB|nr:hypothetical protein [Blautia coccoides]MCR1989776.1 hypothetical protein [Blautia coccoides]
MRYYAVKKKEGVGCVIRDGEWDEEKRESLKEEGFQIFTDKDKANQAVKKASSENRNIIKEK